MGLFDLLFGRDRVIITDSEIIILKGDKVIIKNRHHHDSHKMRIVLSSLSLFSQDNHNLIISKTGGEIMETSFKKTQGQSYTLLFPKVNGETGQVDLSSIQAVSTDGSIVTVQPDPNDPTVGQILGVSNGVAKVVFNAKSKAGQVQLPALSVDVTIADAQGPPDTTEDAASIAATLGAVFNQDGSPIV